MTFDGNTSQTQCRRVICCFLVLSCVAKFERVFEHTCMIVYNREPDCIFSVHIPSPRAKRAKAVWVFSQTKYVKYLSPSTRELSTETLEKMAELLHFDDLMAF